MDWNQEIDRYLMEKRDEIVQNLCKLVRIPSVAVFDHKTYPYGEACAQALDFCAELCQQKGLTTTNYDYRCVEAQLSPQSTGRRLVIASHADVVPADEENLYPPFGGTVHDGYVIGRGVVDDKGPLMATLYALAFFKEKNLPLSNDVRLVFGSNEEQGMDDMLYYLEKAGQPDWGLAVDDDFPTTNGEKGLLRFTISLRKGARIQSIQTNGPLQCLIHDHCTAVYQDGSVQEHTSANGEPLPAHLVSSWNGFLADSAQEAMLKQLCLDSCAAMLDLDRQDEMSGRTLMRLYQIQTKGDDLVFFFDLRLPVSFPAEEAAGILKKAAEKLDLPLELVKFSPGYYIPPEHPIVSLLTDLYNRESQSSEKPYVMSACTYARLFQNGCGYGGGNPHEVKPFPPGHGAAHGSDEAHNIEVLLTAIKMYILGIRAIDEAWS